MKLWDYLIHSPENGLDSDTLKPGKILVVQIAGIGDLVLATPALQALKKKFPDAELDVLTSPRADVLLENFGSVRQIFTFDIERLRNPANLLSPDNMRVLRDQLNPLKAEKYDIVVSMNNVATKRGGITLGFLLKYLGIPVWVGRNTNDRAPYFDLSILEDEREVISEAETKLKVVGLLKAIPESRDLHLNLSDSEREDTLKLMRGKLNLIAFMPGANVDIKMWPIERFIEVGEWLIKKGYNIVVLGGPGDVEVSDKLEDALGKDSVRRLDGKLSLRQTAAALSHVKLALTNDTGPMHIAAAVNIPIVALFCSLNAGRYHPWMDEAKYRLLTSKVPKEETPTGMRESILGVEVEDVKKAICELVE